MRLIIVRCTCYFIFIQNAAMVMPLLEQLV
jgi:hypothetical protein